MHAAHVWIRQETHVTVQHPCAALVESIGCDEETYAELLDVFLDDAPPRECDSRDCREPRRASEIVDRRATESAGLFDVIRRYRSAFAHAA